MNGFSCPGRHKNHTQNHKNGRSFYCGFSLDIYFIMGLAEGKGLKNYLALLRGPSPVPGPTGEGGIQLPPESPPSLGGAPGVSPWCSCRSAAQPKMLVGYSGTIPAARTGASGSEQVVPLGLFRLSDRIQGATHDKFR